MKHFKILGALLVTLSACVNVVDEGNERLNQLITQFDAQSEGAIIFSHTVNDGNCAQASYLIQGKTNSGIPIERRARAIYHKYGTPPVFAASQLPVGKYYITRIDCNNQYTLSGGGPIASFEVIPGAINNLNVVNVKTIKPEKLFGREKLEKNVRPFTKNELSKIESVSPGISNKLVDNPMKANFTEQEKLEAFANLRKL